MDIYRDASAVKIVVPFTDEDGNAVAPLTASYRVYDQDGVDLIASTPYAFTPGTDTEATITVGAVHNTLNGATRLMRVVELKMATDDATIYSNSVTYVIESNSLLTVPENTYQTYEQAQLVAMDIATLTGWDAATDRARRAALVEAYHKIGKLRFRVGYEDWQSRITGTQEVPDVNSLTLSEFNALPADFIAALRRAQVAEADSVLGGNTTQDLRKDGLMSNSVGEVSQMYRPGKPLTLPVSSRALQFLTGYVKYGMRSGRGS